MRKSIFINFDEIFINEIWQNNVLFYCLHGNTARIRIKTTLNFC